MDYEEKERILNYVISGTISCPTGDTIFFVKPPSITLRLKADYIYNIILDEVKYESWITQNKAMGLLIKSGLWTFEGDKNLKELNKRIDELKVELFKSSLKTKEEEKIRKQLSQVRAKYDEMVNAKHLLDHITPEGFATNIKNEYIIAGSVYNNQDKRLWNDFEIDRFAYNYNLLSCIIYYVSITRLNVLQIREFVRTEPWRPIWNAGKENLFGIPAVDWIEDQKAVILFSKMYDSVYEAVDFPGDSIIEDDDKLDGWMILQRRDRDIRTNQNFVDKLLTEKQKKATEFFIPIGVDEDIQKINSLNDMEGRIIKSQREKVIQTQGEAKDLDFADVRLKLSNEAHQKFMSRVKGKR